MLIQRNCGVPVCRIGLFVRAQFTWQGQKNGKSSAQRSWEDSKGNTSKEFLSSGPALSWLTIEQSQSSAPAAAAKVPSMGNRNARVSFVNKCGSSRGALEAFERPNIASGGLPMAVFFSMQSSGGTPPKLLGLLRRKVGFTELQSPANLQRPQKCVVLQLHAQATFLYKVDGTFPLSSPHRYHALGSNFNT